MNRVTNSLSLQFNEAKDFYNRLAFHAEDLTVKHALIKVSDVFKKMQETANTASSKKDFEQALSELSSNWCGDLTDLNIGIPNQPHVSVLQQRVEIEKANLAKLRRITSSKDDLAIKRWLADLTAQHLDAIEYLTQYSNKKDLT